MMSSPKTQPQKFLKKTKLVCKKEVTIDQKFLSVTGWEEETNLPNSSPPMLIVEKPAPRYG